MSICGAQCIHSRLGKAFQTLLPFADSPANEGMRRKDLDITVDLGTGGKHTHRMYTCDLSREYIRINADYHT